MELAGLAFPIAIATGNTWEGVRWASASDPSPNEVAWMVGACLLFLALYFGSLVRHVIRGTSPGSVPALPTRIPAPSPDLVLRGGARVNGIHASWPMATLVLDRERAELQCPLADVIRISRDEVAGVRWTRRLNLGVRFGTDSGRLDKVIFWPIHPQQARDQMRALGWS